MTTDQPLALAADVHLVRSLPGRDGPERLAINSLVLRSPGDTVLVDTGAATGRDAWWEQVESIVDPGDVRWVFLSHDDADHVGNLPEVLERCDQATIVTSWQLGERLAATVSVPLDRCRWLNDGERTALGEREVVAVRPPAFDAPTTRGLYDVASKVYWAADCFGVPVPHPVDEVSQLDRDVWDHGLLRFGSLLSPWVAQVDPRRWRQAVSRVAALDLRAVASAHGPAIRQRDVDHALDLLAELPEHPEEAAPGQRELEALIAATRAA
ncbi:MAG: putative flavodoxin [Ilumatobacteraceae bacterium]|nr:putative flavodoxin [Ilumatobacteraceae bacterium]